MTSPSSSSSAPPESPETMGASVWMRSVSVSPAAVPSDCVVMVWPSAVTWPLAAVSVPVPPALPTPVTASPTWTPPVVTVSGLTGTGLDGLWAKVLDHRGRLGATGELEAKRREQDLKWMWALVHERMHERLAGDPRVRGRVPEIERAVAAGTLSPTAGADEIADLIGLA